MSSCSIAPGVPGLKTSFSRDSKPQKEGVDYKLVIINADTINKQRPFDYAAYVRAKKQRVPLFISQTESNGSKDSVIYSANDQEKNQNSRPAGKAMSGFEGITSDDNKENYQYYIGKGDVLSISVWEQPELTDTSSNNGGHIVGNDGSISFPYVGKINTLGKSTSSIRDELASKLKSYITNPRVIVSIAQYRSQKIYTSGALAKPSTLIIKDTPTTVRDAISNSGGLLLNKYTGYATLARNNKNVSIDLNRMIKLNDDRQNFILENGDRLHVVERTELDEFNRILNLEVRKQDTLSTVRLRNDIIKERSILRLRKELERELRSEQAKVFVMGEVLKPGSVKYQVEDGMTLAEAINDAGSFKEDSVNPKGIFVVRKENNNDKIPTVYQLPISSVQSVLFAEQFDVRPRDIVYVTATPSIRWNRVLAQLLPSLAILNTFRNFN
ncbi:polysaccharide biosynthesis/export family protein [uncultured Cocleimonas sp.]|uniref:polysaccharide biosynthesis/export family protein n=1 Tax=uncultured Cocleimonas sp. TaxID=1051587 RepID=UPI002631C834|nr:polysaccharide biosynthesis/export family protein [uncultured Cocleimonas sp.]